MKLLFVIYIVLLSIIYVSSKPVRPAPDQKIEEPKAKEDEQDVTLGVEYERYLKEVVAVLEKDEMFKRKIENASSDDIKTGKIARHLRFVSHDVRSKLDELKRTELDRLKYMFREKEREARSQGHSKRDFRLKFDPRNLVAHMDSSNPDFFGAKDLEFLIKKATQDLEIIDQKREEEFKKYEMEKEHQKREQLKQLDEEKRQEEEKRIEEAEKKHKDHPKLHEPGHKAQLEEVWEEDHDDQDFNPKTFFMEHDLNSDKRLDEEEIEALFMKELEKMYNDSAPEDDMNEKFEEMFRMRQKVVEEIDTNKDRFIDFDEFLAFTNQKEKFESDDGWKGLDEQDVFSEEEFEKFEEQLAKEYPPGEGPPIKTTSPTPNKPDEPVHRESAKNPPQQIHQEPVVENMNEPSN